MWIIGSSKEQAYSLWKERGKKKRIKIIQCSSPDFWYKDFIGYVFEVETVREDNSYIIKERPTGGTHCVEMCDCVVIEEEKEEEIDNINLMELL